MKTALNGGDPNWGRIAQAVGGALLDGSPLHFDIAIEGVTVFAEGSAMRFDQEALNTAVQRDEVEYVVALPGEGRRPRSSSPTSATST